MPAALPEWITRTQHQVLTNTAPGKLGNQKLRLALATPVALGEINVAQATAVEWVTHRRF